MWGVIAVTVCSVFFCVCVCVCLSVSTVSWKRQIAIALNFGNIAFKDKHGLCFKATRHLESRNSLDDSKFSLLLNIIMASTNIVSAKLEVLSKIVHRSYSVQES